MLIYVKANQHSLISVDFTFCSGKVKLGGEFVDEVRCGNHEAISPTFYEQLLRAQIPKVQKKTVKLTSFIALLGSAHVKAALRMLVKLSPHF